MNIIMKMNPVAQWVKVKDINNDFVSDGGIGVLQTSLVLQFYWFNY